MKLRENGGLIIIGIFILLLIGAMVWFILCSGGAATNLHPTASVTATRTETAAATMTRWVEPVETRTAVASKTRTSIPAVTPTASPSPTFTSLPTPRQVGEGDLATYDQVAGNSTISVESLVLVNKDVLLPDTSGYHPYPAGNIVGMMTVRLTNSGAKPLTVSLFNTDLILDDKLVDLGSYAQAGDYSLELGNQTEKADARGNILLPPNTTAQMHIWFDLNADSLPQRFTWPIYCDLALKPDVTYADHIFPQCAEGSMGTVTFKQDLKWAQRGTMNLEGLASMGYPHTWPSPLEVSTPPDDNDLPSCSEEEFAPLQSALNKYVPEHYHGIVFQPATGALNVLQFYALTSGEIATTTLQRAGRSYIIHLARVYYLSNDDQVRSVWLAYGYTDPLLWEEQQGIFTDYNRGFQPFRGDAFLWDPGVADSVMQTAGQGILAYLFGSNVTSASADLLQCPWSSGGLYVPDQIGCSLALHEEYSAGAGSTDSFIQTETASPTWYLFNWSINLYDWYSISNQVCR